jgi:hypothetical protein
VDFWHLLLDAVTLLGAALVLGALMEALRQSAVVGYLLAGTLVGPGVLGLVRGESAVGVIAELGVALLLFSIGLEFSLSRLRGMGLPALGLGLAQVVATLGLTAGLARRSPRIFAALASESPKKRVAALLPAWRMRATGMPPVERLDTVSSMWPSRAQELSGITTGSRPKSSHMALISSTSAGVRWAPGRRFTWPSIFVPGTGTVRTIASTAAAYPSCSEPQ